MSSGPTPPPPRTPTSTWVQVARACQALRIARAAYSAERASVCLLGQHAVIQSQPSVYSGRMPGPGTALRSVSVSAVGSRGKSTAPPSRLGNTTRAEAASVEAKPRLRELNGN